MSVTRGCQVNLRDVHKQYISKGWRVMTTHKLLSERLDLPCRRLPQTKHVPCEGSNTARTAFYTPEFAKRVCEAILGRGKNHMLLAELQGRLDLGDMFGKGTICMCGEGNQHGTQIVCGHCVQQESSFQEGLAEDTRKKEIGERMTKEEIRRRLFLLHSATGHGQIRHLIQTLKRRGVSRNVLKEAEQFRCPVCEERKRPQPRNMSSLEPIPMRFQVVSCDVGHWFHPTTKEKWQFVVCVDESSRFKVARFVAQGKHKHISAAQFISTFKESWIEYFQVPNTLRLDPDGSFRSAELSEFCDQNHIFLAIIPSEAHWKLGICEQSIQSIKHILEHLVSAEPEITAQDALSESIRVLNNKELVRGFSPVQIILGRAPDECGRFFTPLRTVPADCLTGSPKLDMENFHQRRLTAEKAFLDWQDRQRLNRAAHSTHRRVLNFTAGDLVYVWRKQLTGEDAKQDKIGQGRFIGPARILATEKKRQFSMACERSTIAEMLPRTTSTCHRTRDYSFGTT